MKKAIDGFCLLDGQGRLLEVNDAFCEMSGYSAPELLSMRVDQFDVIEDASMVTARLKKIIVQGPDRRFGDGTIETRMKCKDGEELDILLSSTPVEKDDVSAGVTFTALDVTPFNYAQLALKQSEINYRNMMAAIKAPIYICSENKRIQYLNRGHAWQNRL